MQSCDEEKVREIEKRGFRVVLGGLNINWSLRKRAMIEKSVAQQRKRFIAESLTFHGGRGG